MELTQAAADSLAAKLEGLELSDEESAILVGIVNAAAGSATPPEVEGHGWDEGVAAFSVMGVKCDVHPWMNPVWTDMRPL